MKFSDDAFLMHFLRTKKFSMDDVFKVFENHFLFRTTRPEWFDTSDKTLERIKEMSKSGAAYALRKRAPDGSLVYVINLEKLDVDNYKTSDAFNYIYVTLAALMEDEQSQILGCTFVLNYVNCSLKVIGSFSIRDTVEFADSANKCAGRLKKYILIGLPSAANALLTAAKKVMTEKHRDRIVLLKDYDELAQHVDKSALTNYLGGEEPENEVVDDFMKVVETNYGKLQEGNKFNLDMEKAAACRNLEESIGSFRTLDID